jgi:hypothetical protein
MRVLAAIAGILLFTVALVDAFNTIVLARRAPKVWQITGLFYRFTWWIYATVARHIKSGARRERYLGVYGPVSLLTLLVCWAVCTTVGFGLLRWSFDVQPGVPPSSLLEQIYVSASFLFTVGAPEPATMAGKTLKVIEAGVGLSLLALAISYLPVLYQSFSSRERCIALLDARAGSPPTAGEFLAREGGDPTELKRQLAEWEQWTAELLEAELSYPMLAYFRSQHTNQSWLGTLTTIIDASALCLLGATGSLQHQARLTFAICRHALVDLAQVFQAPPRPLIIDRLPPEDFSRLLARLANTSLQPNAVSQTELSRLRAKYEPFAHTLSLYFLIALPPWLPAKPYRDNWETSAWDRKAAVYAVSDPFSQMRSR